MKEKESISASIMGNGAYRNILSRTSVRNYTDQPVSDEIKSAILHAGMSTPPA